MFALKFPPRIPPPRRADRTLLPAALAALLTLLFAAQLVAPMTVELPDAGLTRPMRLPPLAVLPVIADPDIAARPLFAPGRRDVAAPGVADKTAPLGGTHFVGMASAGRGLQLFLQAPDGRVTQTGVGAIYDGWRIVRADRAGLFVTRGAEAATVPISSSVPPVKPRGPAEPPEEEQQ